MGYRWGEIKIFHSKQQQQKISNPLQTLTKVKIKTLWEVFFPERAHSSGSYYHPVKG